MTGPLISWCIVAVIALTVVIARCANIMMHAGVENGHRGHHRLFEVGHECEEFYVPGDTLWDEEYALGDE